MADGFHLSRGMEEPRWNRSVDGLRWRRKQGILCARWSWWLEDTRQVLNTNGSCKRSRLGGYSVDTGKSGDTGGNRNHLTKPVNEVLLENVLQFLVIGSRDQA